ncbi:uncharacterized protein EV154DRAFT_191776 [Mucor mucedo]|uniref:uncharacterized protein n=1 Tax=Mucor mucedo TaxID=29922 RepID=UPI00221FB3C8|nr:uncharacterized protein EV154DRAFT_191776 [Mucor mucedo]KAI7892356.1 hypothetical protein EV154DRAFT_191776 [Mucor mucedo]
MASQINAIDKQSIHKICSGQVVLDLATAIKELVENSIDAGAKSVDVHFKDNGLGGIEVIDDGSGIDPSNYESLALKHYTSKLNSFEDLENVMTFGFRGEALSSLCALCNMTVTTATKEQTPMGYKLEFDMNGVLSSKTPIARSAGTTIQLTNIFYSLPVRQQEFKRNIKREFSKALTIIQAYSIISTSIRISVSNQIAQKQNIRVMSTSGNKDLIANVSNVFGSKLASQIIPFKVDLSSILEKGTVQGFISKPEWGLGRSSADRQYFYVNGRPCSLPKLSKALNETYRTFISNQYPVLIADLQMPTNTYDVNVSPDKRTIFVHDEAKIAEAIMEQLKQQLEPSRSTYNVNPLMKSTPRAVPVTDMDFQNTTMTEGNEIADTPMVVESVVPSSSSSNMYTDFSNKRVPTTNISKTASRMSNPIKSLGLSRSSGNGLKATGSTFKRPAPLTSSLLNYLSKRPKTADNEEEEEVDEIMQQENGETESNIMEIEPSTEESDVDFQENERISHVDTKMYTGITSTRGSWNTFCRKVQASVNTDDIKLKATTSNETEDSDTVQAPELVDAGITNTQDHEKAARALNRVISKPDFAEMKVLGQFNLGFIITNLNDKDIYIIDQHASDEKYNFETLQQITKMETQSLYSPQELDLTASEEHVVMDNLEIFKANGFGVQVFPDNEPTKRIRVISQPVSKNTMFDKKDFCELIYLINERPGEMVRCSRVRNMFAMRACHKAVRIGQSLHPKKMTQIVQHMGEIDQPWNCPHGRPTMRHLLHMDQFKPARRDKPLALNGSFSILK